MELKFSRALRDVTKHLGVSFEKNDLKITTSGGYNMPKQ